MSEFDSTLADDRKALAGFLDAARRIPVAAWTSPRGPGKWSPAQIAEHVALSYELSLAAMRGAFPGAAAPTLVRPLIRTFFLQPVLRNGRFKTGGKAPAAFRPSPAPGPAEVVLPRLEAAVGAFEQALKAEVAAGHPSMNHPFFGKVSLVDYLRLQVIHLNHHRNQLPAVAAA